MSRAMHASLTRQACLEFPIGGMFGLQALQSGQRVLPVERRQLRA